MRGILSRGDVIWVARPKLFAKFDPRNTRPAVVLAVLPDKSVGVAFMSSNITQLYVGDVVVPANSETGLKKPSKVMCYARANISPQLITKQVGQLSPDIMAKVETGLGLTYPNPDI